MEKTLIYVCILSIWDSTSIIHSLFVLTNLRILVSLNLNFVNLNIYRNTQTRSW